MNCEQAQSLLSELLDDELPADARAGVEAHLAACAGCAKSYKALRRSVGFVRANTKMPRAETAGGYYAEAMRAMVDETVERTPLEIYIESAQKLPVRGARTEETS